MTLGFVPPVKYQLFEEVNIPTGRGNVQFWLRDKDKLLLAISQSKKQTEVPPNSLWILHYLAPEKVKKIG